MSGELLQTLVRLAVSQERSEDKLDKIEKTQALIITRLEEVEKRQFAGRVAIAVGVSVSTFFVLVAAWFFDHISGVKAFIKSWG